MMGIIAMKTSPVLQPNLLAQLFYLFSAFSLIILQSTIDTTTSIFMFFKILGNFQDGFGHSSIIMVIH